MEKLRTVEKKEGRVVFYAPDDASYGRMEDAPVFYNPLMRLSRDVSVAVASVFSPSVVLDPLAATGIRGLRYAAELGCEAVLNDKNPLAYGLVSKNILFSGLSANARAENRDANSLMFESKHSFDLVDVDPFGSPAEFTQAALEAGKNKSLVSLTATDTACLSGVYPKACLRKYGSFPVKTPFHHEMGLRILLCFLSREAAKTEKGVTPVFSHATMHYYKVFAKAKSGRKRADESLSENGFACLCPGCGNFAYEKGLFFEKEKTCGFCGKKTLVFGPLWLGQLYDHAVCEKALDWACRQDFFSKDSLALLSAAREEAKGGVFFHDLHYLCKKHGGACPKTSVVLDSLRKKGFSASGTHLSPVGVRTDAPFGEFLRVIGKQKRF